MSQSTSYWPLSLLCGMALAKDTESSFYEKVPSTSLAEDVDVQDFALGLCAVVTIPQRP
jgi:hypothetical protein